MESENKTMTEIHETCDLVIKHEGVLGSLVSDISHIRQKIDNGLSQKLDDVKEALLEAKTELERKTTNLEQKIAVVDEQSWLSKVLTAGVKKAILVVIGIVVLSSISNNALWSILRTHYYHEPPGIIQQIANKQDLATTYHTHLMSDGSIIFHAGDANTPAWKFDQKSNAWVRAPQYREESSIRETEHTH
jgi:hypothetical protein